MGLFIVYPKWPALAFFKKTYQLSFAPADGLLQVVDFQ
jgi:hypothetical protein